ncbi:MAG: Gfo/Idh/MocA family oxidoreductase [Bdellovibrionales bacterium]|nr:Gfo/Idh/MocA family oxidoreductase [Bdellovibrionales bacterium]
MTSLKCAVVGVGHLGRFHAQKYQAAKNAELVAVCDPSSDRLKAMSEELKVPGVSNYKDLLGKVDAVTVAAITPAHYEISKFFLENSVHVNVEKPLTTTSQEGEELCKIAESKNLVLQVGHVERFNPALISAQKKLKEPLFIECHRLAPFKPRSMDVSVVLDLMIHDLDVILSLVKSEPIAVSAIGSPVLTSLPDIANARIEFASGCVANVTSSRVSQRSERKFRVFQPSQYLSIDFGSGEVNLLTKTGELTGDLMSGEVDLPLEADAWSLEKGDALLAETQSFVDSIVESRPPVVSGRDGLIALRLAEKILEDINQRLKNK